MSDLEKTKFSEIASNIEFENDFGQEPLGLARLTQDQAAIAIGSLVGAFVGSAVAGVPLALIVIAVGLNDILSINKRHRQRESAARAEPIDVDARAVEPVVLPLPIGQDTKLNASEVKVEPVSDSFADLSVRSSSLPPFDRTRITNESKGLMIIGDMGAAKTCVAQYIANGFDGYGIIVFDPHGMTDWGNAYVITKMGAIYEQMRILLDLLENGDTSPLLIICDEWLEIRGDRRNKKGSDYAGLADDFIRLFSTKPRKFNKLAAFVLHSPNVEAAGVDSFLRENYLKVYLGRLAKKEFPNIRDCAYPCVLEDDQQEHPTHGHHSEFKPKGKAPRSLQPLNSAPIDIPLAYMDRGEVKVHQGGWADGSFSHATNIRQRLEFLLDDTGIDTRIDTGTRERTAKNSDTGTDTSIDTDDSEPDTADTGSAETIGNTGDSADTELDTSDTFTPAQLPKAQVLKLIEQMKVSGLSQTQIIQALWGCEKNKTGWKQAYVQFKELMGDDQP